MRHAVINGVKTCGLMKGFPLSERKPSLYRQLYGKFKGLGLQGSEVAKAFEAEYRDRLKNDAEFKKEDDESNLQKI